MFGELGAAGECGLDASTEGLLFKLIKFWGNLCVMMDYGFVFTGVSFELV